MRPIFNYQPRYVFEVAAVARDQNRRTFQDNGRNGQIEFPKTRQCLPKHRIPFEPTSPGITKMGEFAEHVRKQEAGYLESWLNEACLGDPNRAVCFRIEQAPGSEEAWETLNFNLCELGKTLITGEPLMGSNLEQFGRFINAAYGNQDERDDHDPDQRPPL